MEAAPRTAVMPCAARGWESQGKVRFAKKVSGILGVGFSKRQVVLEGGFPRRVVEVLEVRL
eukprot:4565775-Pleurochrysis_carterae.AAC.1